MVTTARNFLGQCIRSGLGGECCSTKNQTSFHRRMSSSLRNTTRCVRNTTIVTAITRSSVLVLPSRFMSNLSLNEPSCRCCHPYSERICRKLSPQPSQVKYSRGRGAPNRNVLWFFDGVLLGALFGTAWRQRIELLLSGAFRDLDFWRRSRGALYGAFSYAGVFA
jgi:hypothetical protein